MVVFEGRWAGRFSHEHRQDGVYEVCDEIFWNINTIYIPEILEARVEYVIEAIRESLARYGVWGVDKGLKSVEVEILNIKIVK